MKYLNLMVRNISNRLNIKKNGEKELISQLALKGDETILDLGCGDGILTEQLSSFVPNGKVIGIDASTGMIETAKEN